jgi:hypothetical protein
MCVYYSTILQVLLLDGRPLCKLSLVKHLISRFLHFSFYEPVYYHSYSDTYPSASNEEQGCWVGVATHVGDELTYKILAQKQRLIYWSAIRSALDSAKRNQSLSSLGEETVSNYLGDKNFSWSKMDLVKSSIEDGTVLHDDLTIQLSRELFFYKYVYHYSATLVHILNCIEVFTWVV